MPKTTKSSPNESVQRLSISIPRVLSEAIDALVALGGFQNRSQAIAEMAQRCLQDYQQHEPKTPLVGVITLQMDVQRKGLAQRLAAIVDEANGCLLGSMQVPISEHQCVQIYCMHGEAEEIRKLADQFSTCKGVTSSGLSLLAQKK